MAKISNNLTELIGKTPLVSLSRFAEEKGAKAKIVAKLEYFNPGGSVKDRIAMAMICQAEQANKLKPGFTIIEPTSGNTGIGLAWVAAIKGYKLILTMPDTMSRERQSILKALGAEIILTPGAEGMKGAIIMAEELNNQMFSSVLLRQFSNPANTKVHELTTARELWDDTDGEIDILVAGVGTGGTITGTGRELKKLNPNIKIVAVEPLASNVLSGGQVGKHKIQGIGAGFIPQNYDASLVDQVIAVDDDEAIGTSRILARKEGLIVGISSGAATYAALKLALLPENENKTIVAILPDTGERYLSTVLYDTEQYPI